VGKKKLTKKQIAKIVDIGLGDLENKKYIVK